MKTKKPRQILLLSILSVVLLTFSLFSHLQIALLADKFIEKSDIKPLVFSEWHGDLWNGQVQLSVAGKQETDALGKLNWRNSLLDWLLLNPQVQSSLRANESHLKLDAGYEILGGLFELTVDDSRIAIQDLKPLWQLNREYGRWLNGVKGQFRNLNLQSHWQEQQQWFSHLTGSAQLVDLQFMGESFPPIQLKILQQQQDVILQLRANDNWQMQGEVTLKPIFAEENKLIAVSYHGAMKVQADAAEALPNWASLMQAQGDSAAITKISGQLQLH